MRFKAEFDVIVIGGGHAGTEAALAAARMGAITLLLTHNIETLGQMSCNPAIGGIGKGHLVKEIDALGGAMALAADQSAIQLRTLNASKGPAVRATRAQADRRLYKHAIRRMLETQPNLQLFQQEVADLILPADPRPGFSYPGTPALRPRRLPCHIPAPNERTHAIIRGATARSPMFTGLIEGSGPRYCPSVEDKVVRFAER